MRPLVDAGSRVGLKVPVRALTLILYCNKRLKGFRMTTLWSNVMPTKKELRPSHVSVTFSRKTSVLTQAVDTSTNARFVLQDHTALYHASKRRSRRTHLVQSRNLLTRDSDGTEPRALKLSGIIKLVFKVIKVISVVVRFVYS